MIVPQRGNTTVVGKSGTGQHVGEVAVGIKRPYRKYHNTFGIKLPVDPFRPPVSSVCIGAQPGEQPAYLYLIEGGSAQRMGPLQVGQLAVVGIGVGIVQIFPEKKLVAGADLHVIAHYLKHPGILVQGEGSLVCTFKAHSGRQIVRKLYHAAPAVVLPWRPEIILNHGCTYLVGGISHELICKVGLGCNKKVKVAGFVHAKTTQQVFKAGRWPANVELIDVGEKIETAACHSAGVVALVRKVTLEAVGTPLGIHGNHTRSQVAVLHIHPSGGHFYIGIGTGPQVEAQPGAGKRILCRYTINDIAGFVGPAPANVQTRRIAEYPGLQANNLINPSNGRRLDLVPGHIGCGRRLFDIENRPFANHHHFLIGGKCLLVQTDIELGGFACRYPDSGNKLAFIAQVAHLDGVLTGTDISDFIIAVHIGCGPKTRSANNDVHSDKRFPVPGVVYSTGNGSGGLTGSTGVQNDCKNG